MKSKLSNASNNKNSFKNVKKFKKQFESENESSENENTESDLSTDDEISKDQIDYSIPKPGPHAKADEWRKWKKMKRAIRQQRVERRIRKLRRQEDELKETNEIKKNLNELKQQGRNFTLSIAVPSSIIAKVQSKELKTYVAGQIARAACLFCVDEIVVYNEYTIENDSQKEITQQLVKILEYLECPQYLRKSLFPPHKYLEHVGLLNPLEAPHHFRINDEWEYREGVVTDIPTKENKGSWVDIGLMNKIQVDKKLKAGIRVTVKKHSSSTNSSKLRGIIVSPETPRTQDGIYWGYQVRYADWFREMLYESTFNDTYDLKIAIDNKHLCFDEIKNLPKANHVLVVFGGIQGIEAAIEADEKLKANKIDQIFKYKSGSDETKNIFGSRSIRLEELLLISLAIIRPALLDSYKEKETNGVATTQENDENSDD